MKRFQLAAISLTAATLLSSYSLLTFSSAQTERVVKITARKFTYEPKEIELKLGVPVVLELTSKDVTHGFNLPDLGLRADLEPGETARVRLIPEKAGTYEFYCDNFCGLDHEIMTATITVQ